MQIHLSDITDSEGKIIQFSSEVELDKISFQMGDYPILEKIVERFKKSVANDAKRQEAVISYDIDEYDERFLRHLALGYTKEMIANLKGMPFGVKSLEKRQNDLIGRLFPQGERVGVNATRLVVRALELRIIDLDNLEADEE